MYGDNEDVAKCLPTAFCSSRDAFKILILTQFIQDVITFSICCGCSFHKSNGHLEAEEM